MQTLSADKFYQVSVNSRNFGFIQTLGNNTKVSPCPRQKRNVTPLFWVDLTFKKYGDAMVLCVFIVIIFVSNQR